MAQAEQAKEPSMEEILASIRRIIADDEAGAPRGGSKPSTSPAAVNAATQAKPAPVPEPASEETLDEMFAEAAEEADQAEADFPEADAADSFDSAEDDDDAFELSTDAIVGDDEDGQPKALSESEDDDIVFTDLQETMPDLDEVMVADDSEALQDDSDFDTGMASPPRAAPNGAEPGGRPLLSAEANSSVSSAFHNLAHTILSRDARTLEDLVEDLLRPMLKDWLDENLPPLVERLVRSEIERVARGGR